MAMQECKRAILGKALEDLVARARSGKEPCRIGLMASGGEHSDAEFLAAASAAMSADPALTVVGVGPKPSGILPQGMDCCGLPPSDPDGSETRSTVNTGIKE